jgi:hypothetical protein
LKTARRTPSRIYGAEEAAKFKSEPSNLMDGLMIGI